MLQHKATYDLIYHESAGGPDCRGFLWGEDADGERTAPIFRLRFSVRRCHRHGRPCQVGLGERLPSKENLFSANVLA